MAPECPKPARLGDLISIKHGWPFKSEFFSPQLTGRPIVVSVGNFQYTGGFRFETTSVNEYRSEHPREYELTAGDTLLIMTCQTPDGEILGIPARVPDDGRVYLHNQRLGKVVLKRPDLVDPRYLYWVFLSKPFNQELCASATGTKIVHTAPTRIEAYQFDLPPLPEQRAIAAVLGALDDKIEVNRKTARVLEGIARAVFTSWFVDFDPVRRAAAGRPTGLPADLAALFPKRMVDSAIGEVPEGWVVGTIGDLLSLSRDAIDPGDHPTEEFDHFSIPAFDMGQMPSNDRGGTIKSQKFVVSADCVLVSKLNPRTPRVWLPPAAAYRRQVASTEFLVCTGNKVKHVSREFVYCMATSGPLIEYLTTHASGTSNSHQRVRPQDFLDFQCVQPPTDVLLAFTRAAGPIFGRIATSRAQSSTLAALRDALLPKLISGELRIADAEKIVGRAANG